MAEDKIELQLDKNSFAGGEVVHGSVIISAAEKSSCQMLTVAIGWETRGKGIVESWYSEPLKINCGETSTAGGRYAFSLQVPNGPLSYGGTILSVGWFVKAHADLKLHPDLSAKVPITVSAIKPGEPYIYGLGWNTGGVSPGNVPLRFSPDEKGMATRDFNYRNFQYLYKWLAVGIVLFIVGLLGGNKVPKLDPLWTLLLIAGVLVIVSGVYGLFVRKNIRSWQITSPSHIQQGSAALPVSISMTAARQTRLTRIEARVRCQEHTRSDGNRPFSRDHVIYEGEYLVIAQDRQLMPDAPETFRADLTLPAKAVSSFHTAYNSIDWRFTIRLTIPESPTIEEDVPFLMMP